MQGFQKGLDHQGSMRILDTMRRKSAQLGFLADMRKVREEKEIPSTVSMNADLNELAHPEGV